ncbi:helix-turn-helix domain-containing protein [Flavobacteriaceae bacterium AU392]|nr:AraC family transcriptional regulator [Flavobacteriaceae bacterium]RKM85898.1 helix-turn-helix domain-containing protein [Flavobacteriaceae bacterium AU392]
MSFHLLKIELNSQLVLAFISLLGVIWALFLLIHERGNRLANKFLAILIFVLSIFVLRRIADINTSIFFQLTYFLSHAFVYLIGPSIYLYIKSLTESKIVLKKIWIHYTLWALAMLLMLFTFIFKEQILKTDNIEFLKILSIFLIITQVIHITTYIFYAKKQLKNTEKKLVRKQQTSISVIRFKWMEHLMIVAVIFGFLILLMHFLIITGGYYEINNSVDFLFLTMLCIIILNIIYKSWKQPEIISGIYKENYKYKNSQLSDTELKKLKSNLEVLIKTEEIYLIPELSLNQLAVKMNIQAHTLSQLINEHYNQTFFNFINRFRIEYAKNKIKEGEIINMTFEGIAYESGFNSKSTFNRAFKKYMNCTPKQYYKTLIKE